MSALSNTTPTPVQQPPQRVSPVATPEPPKSTFPWKGLLILAIIGAGAWSAYQFLIKPQQEAKNTPTVVYRTAKIAVGPFERSVRIGGVTSARQYANITSPRLRGFESRSLLELLTLVKSGTWVKKGEVLAQIDPGQVVDHVDDIKSTINEAESDVKKRQAEQGIELESILQTLRVSKSSVDKARLDNQAAEVRTDVEREILKLSFEEAEAKYQQSQLDIPQKQIMHGAEVKILGFTTERHMRHRNRHLNDIKAYTISSPMEGMAVLSSVFRGGESQQLQSGDQVNPGQPLLKVVNPASMQVEANVNQADATGIRIGQKATVRLDAFPGLAIPGKVYSIGALAVGGWRQNFYIRNIPVRVTIDGADPRLIPDLSASADIVLEGKADSPLVPLEAIFHEGGKNYVYAKQSDGQFLRREVTLGEANNLHAAALAGLSGGEELRLQ